MAKVKVKYKAVRCIGGCKMREQETVVRLDLNENEAQFLVDLLMYVGGDPNNSRRRHSDSIVSALKGAGYVSDTERRRADFDGRIYLSDQAVA